MEVVSDSPVNGLGIEQVSISYNDASESTNYQQLLSYPTIAPVTVTPNAAAGRWRSISAQSLACRTPRRRSPPTSTGLALEKDTVRGLEPPIMGIADESITLSRHCSDEHLSSANPLRKQLIILHFISFNNPISRASKINKSSVGTESRPRCSLIFRRITCIAFG